jgi:hypothetical protein
MMFAIKQNGPARDMRHVRRHLEAVESVWHRVKDLHGADAVFK